MTKTPPNHGKTWTKADVAALKDLAAGNTPTRVIGMKMGRTEEAVRSAAQRFDIPLNPPNQPPYGPRKKRNP